MCKNNPLAPDRNRGFGVERKIPSSPPGGTPVSGNPVSVDFPRTRLVFQHSTFVRLPEGPSSEESGRELINSESMADEQHLATES